MRLSNVEYSVRSSEFHDVRHRGWLKAARRGFRGGLEEQTGTHHMTRALSPFRAQEILLAVLLANPLACCRWELERRRMIPPSNFVLRIIIEEDPSLVRHLNARYADAARDGGLETAERDALFDILGLHFTGRTWPREGGMQATRRFMTELLEAMSATNWKVDLLAA